VGTNLPKNAHLHAIKRGCHCMEGDCCKKLYQFWKNGADLPLPAFERESFPKGGEREKEQNLIS